MKHDPVNLRIREVTFPLPSCCGAVGDGDARTNFKHLCTNRLILPREVRFSIWFSVRTGLLQNEILRQIWWVKGAWSSCKASIPAGVSCTSHIPTNSSIQDVEKTDFHCDKRSKDGDRGGLWNKGTGMLVCFCGYVLLWLTVAAKHVIPHVNRFIHQPNTLRAVCFSYTWLRLFTNMICVNTEMRWLQPQSDRHLPS